MYSTHHLSVRFGQTAAAEFDVWQVFKFAATAGQPDLLAGLFA